MMQEVTSDRCSMASLDAMYSASGSGPSGFKYGSTAMILSQKVSKLTTKSFTTGMLPAGSTVMTPSIIMSLAWDLQASPAWPFIRIAQEPQIELRQEQRRLKVPSVSSRTLIRASNTVPLSSIVAVKSSQ